MEEEIMNNSKEEYMRKIIERQKQREADNSSRQIHRRKVIDQGREKGHQRLFTNYFAENPIYTDVKFWQRFQM